MIWFICRIECIAHSAAAVRRGRSRSAWFVTAGVYALCFPLPPRSPLPFCHPAAYPVSTHTAQYTLRHTHAPPCALSAFRRATDIQSFLAHRCHGPAARTTRHSQPSLSQQRCITSLFFPHWSHWYCIAAAQQIYSSSLPECFPRSSSPSHGTRLSYPLRSPSSVHLLYLRCRCLRTTPDCHQYQRDTSYTVQPATIVIL